VHGLRRLGFDGRPGASQKAASSSTTISVVRRLYWARTFPPFHSVEKDCDRYRMNPSIFHEPASCVLGGVGNEADEAEHFRVLRI